MAVAVVMTAGVMTLAPAQASARTGTTVVMTRNLYLGADLIPAVGSPDAPSLAQAAADVFEHLKATDFPRRSKLIAEEIADARPDLIGLQEVALWRTGAFNDPSEATTVALDFLEELEHDLAALDLAYTTAVVQETFDAEVPASQSSGDVPVFKDIRLTQRNVILVREGVDYGNARSATYATNLVFPGVGGIPGNDLVDVRGWQSIDVLRADGHTSFRFVNTHLDAFAAPIRTAQAQELVDGPLRTPNKVVAVGDFNSPPAGPDSGAYQVLTSRSNGKLRDVWREAKGQEAGFTCCQAADLRNADSTASTRIDLVLTRTPAVKARAARLVGTSAPTADGLWASDHFGVVAGVSLPR